MSNSESGHVGGVILPESTVVDGVKGAILELMKKRISENKKETIETKEKSIVSLKEGIVSKKREIEADEKELVCIEGAVKKLKEGDEAGEESIILKEMGDATDLISIGKMLSKITVSLG